MVSSMTGFGRAEGVIPGFHWAWEVRSVNAKSLDVRFRLPPGFDSLEQGLKAMAGASLLRGSINATLSVAEATRAPSIRINETVLAQIIGVIRTLEQRLDAAPPRLDGLLQIRGLIESADDAIDDDEWNARVAAISAGFAQALAALNAARDAEGGRIGDVLSARLAEIATLVASAENAAAAQPAAIRMRFRRQMDELLQSLPPLPEERLAQELAMLIQRADVREEIDRLKSHIGAASDLLAQSGGVGRKLDFLCQEFNREANTLCSKATELDLTRLGLDLKAAIEQLREQVQNIE